MRKFQSESQNLASQYNEEKRRLEERIQEMDEKSRRDTERTAAEYSQKLKILEEQLSHTSSAAVEEREALQKQITELQKNRRATRVGLFANIGRALDRFFRLI